MNHIKTCLVALKYTTLLADKGLAPVRNGDAVVALDQLEHAAWMCAEILKMPPEKEGKAFRWLGFVQGIFFCTGFRTVDEMKKDNMPDAEKVTP